MDRKITDPYTDEQLDIINRYRLERIARQYMGDKGSIIKDTPEKITIRLPPYAIPTKGAAPIGYVMLTNEIGHRGFRKLKYAEAV